MPCNCSAACPRRSSANNHSLSPILFETLTRAIASAASSASVAEASCCGSPVVSRVPVKRDATPRAFALAKKLPTRSGVTVAMPKRRPPADASIMLA